MFLFLMLLFLAAAAAARMPGCWCELWCPPVGAFPRAGIDVDSVA